MQKIITPSSYTNDENGLRTTKTVVSASGTSVNTYLYDTAGTLLRQIVENPDGTTDIMEFMYDENGRPYAVLLNSTIYYYILNLQGDVVQVADSWGRAHATYTYNAWGKLLSAQAGSYSGAQKITDLNPLRYRGYVYDTETQLYYLQSRYYDPNLGRFLNPDVYTSTGQGILGYNMFAYCNNNPINTSDETGKNPIISGLIGAGTAAVCSLISGERGWGVLDSAIQGFIAGAIPVAGIIISLNDSVELGMDVAKRTGNDFFGVIAFGLNIAVSSFTGDNFAKLKGVVGMDEAAKLFFDACFGFMANVFHSQAMVEIFPESSDIPTTYNQTSSANMIKPSQLQNKHQHVTAY